MLDEFRNLNIGAYSDSELIALFRQIVPVINELLERFGPKQLSCQDCLKKIECKQFNRNKSDITCLMLESSLPGRYEGIGYREKNSGLMIEDYENPESDIPEDIDDIGNHIKINKETLKSVRKTKLDEEFMLYKNCPPGTFTAEQWEVIYLRFEHGLKQREITEIIGIEGSAVGDRLRRAKKNMNRYYKSKKGTRQDTINSHKIF